jgi:hypothetical protein
MMVDDPGNEDENSEAEAMEEVQEEAAHEREDEGGYQ